MRERPIPQRVWPPRKSEVIVLDEFELRAVSVTEAELELEGRMIKWHAEPMAIGLGYAEKETDGHEAETSIDDGSLLASE